MVISVSNKREFIPKFNGNENLQASEQIRIMHRAPTLSIKERLFPKIYQFDKEGEITGSFEVDRYKVCKEFIQEIFNVKYDIDGEGVVTVRTTDDLFKAPPEYDGLIDELYAHFQEILNTKVQEKN